MSFFGWAIIRDFTLSCHIEIKTGDWLFYWNKNCIEQEKLVTYIQIYLGKYKTRNYDKITLFGKANSNISSALNL